MKEFKKWLKQQLPYDPYCCAGMAESAWRESLKWALSKKLSIDELIDEDGTEILSVIPSNDIEKELETETR